MKRNISIISTVILSVSLLSGCIQPDHLVINHERTDVLSHERMGQVIFGAPLDRIESILAEEVSDQIDDFCSMVEFNAYPGTYFMVEGGVVTRADAAARVPNVLGVIVGDNLEDILKKYPQARVEGHKYLAEGYYLIFPSYDGQSAIVIEVGDDGRAFEILAGLQPSVRYVEHCQ